MAETADTERRGPGVAARIRGHSVTRTAIGLYAVQAGVLVIPLLTLPYLTRVLSPANFGLLIFTQAFASLVTVTLDFGFDLSASRQVARRRDDRAYVRELVASVLGAKLVLLLATLVLTAVAGLAVPLLRDHREYLALGWTLGVLQGFSPLWYFLGRERIGVQASLDFASRLVAALGIFAFVHDPADGNVVLGIQATTAGVALVAALAIVHRQTSFGRPRIRLALASLRGGVGLAVYRSAAIVQQTIPALIVGVLASPIQVGYYGVADKLHKVPIAGLWPFSQALYPWLNRLFVRDPTHAFGVFRMTLAVSAAGGVVVGLALAYFAPVLVPLVFGSQYEEAVPVFRLLALALIPGIMAHVMVYQVLMPLGKDRYLAATGWSVVGLVVLLAAVLTPPYGAQGMSVSVLAGATAYALTLGVGLTRRTPVFRRRAAAELASPKTPVPSPAPRVRDGRIAAVVVTHNRLELLRECVDAVRAQTHAVDGIIVVDNASSDGTAEWLAAQPDVTTLRQSDAGSAGGMHTGIARALADGYDAMWMLDDDALPLPDALERLVHAPANTGVNVVGSIVVSKNDRRRLAFHVPKLESYNRLLDYHRELTDRVDDLHASAVDSLGYPWSMFTNSILLPRAIVETIGLPRREFYMGGEEVEYHYRVRDRGFGTYLVLDSICLHPKNPFGSIPRWKMKSLVRNTVYTHRHYRRWFLLRTFRRLLLFVWHRQFDLIPPLWHGFRNDFSRRY